MNTICLIDCGFSEVQTIQRNIDTLKIFLEAGSFFYPDGNTGEKNILGLKNLSRPGMTFDLSKSYLVSYPLTHAMINLSGFVGPPWDISGDKVKISYLIGLAVTIEYLPQGYSFNVGKKEFKEDLADDSVFISGLTTFRTLNMSGENMTKKCFDEMVDFLENDYCYVNGLDEGGFVGRFSFSGSRIRGQTEIYSYDISIEEVGKA